MILCSSKHDGGLTDGASPEPHLDARPLGCGAPGRNLLGVRRHMALRRSVFGRVAQCPLPYTLNPLVPTGTDFQDADIHHA